MLLLCWGQIVPRLNAESISEGFVESLGTDWDRETTTEVLDSQQSPLQAEDHGWQLGGNLHEISYNACTNTWTAEENRNKAFERNR